MIDSLWMSSISNACPAVLLTNTALVKDVRWPVPHSEATPLPPSSRTTSKIFRVQGSMEPWRHTPSPSRKLNLTRSMTRAGRSPARVSAANLASSRVASGSSGACELLIIIDFLPIRARCSLSLPLYVGFTDQLGPFLGVLGDKLAQLCRRHHEGRASEIGKPRFHLSVDYACIHFIVDLLDDLDGSSLWRTNAVPRNDVITRDEFADARDLG